MHADPAKSTWIKAIRKGNYAGWPLLSAKNVHAHYPETDKTPMGRLNQTRTNVRSTKRKQVPLPKEKEEELKRLVGKKERDVCVKIIDTHDMKNTIYSDQTGKFPVRAWSRNRYIMVMVEIDSNYTLVQPIKIGQTVR